ncbi:MAG: AAA family ATPase [Patescibacteria group bacterium]|jgi:predicted ATP-dependent endonuclease of OLD family
MKIIKLKINCYKSIKEPMILELQSPSILIGQNNSGKSNVFDAIEFALGGRIDDSNIFYEKADIEIELLFDDHEQDKNNFPDAKATFVLKNQQRKLIFPSQEINYNKNLSILLSSNIKILDQEAFHDYHQIELDYHSLFNYPINLEKFKEHLKHNFPKISATKNALDIRYENDGLYEGKRRVTIDRLGSGFRRVFTMLLYIFHPQYSIVMISEPETHLHPAIIKKLFWAMQNSNFGQIIFSTHSPLFVTPISLGHVIRIVKDDNNLTKAFALDHKKYNYQRLIQELNADNLEMFFTDKVILVEGVSDRLLIRGLIDKFYTGQKDIKVIQTHGKGNMKLYVDLLKIFQIPFLVVFDKDSMKTNHLRDLMYYLQIHLPPLNDYELINALKKYDIYVFPNGDLEDNYPRKYQRDDSKTINALKAANLMTIEDYKSKSMINLKEIIENI